jgi:hypothetical protein
VLPDAPDSLIGALAKQKCRIFGHQVRHAICYTISAGILVFGNGNANAAPALVFRWAAFFIGT